MGLNLRMVCSTTNQRPGWRALSRAREIGPPSDRGLPFRWRASAEPLPFRPMEGDASAEPPRRRAQHNHEVSSEKQTAAPVLQALLICADDAMTTELGWIVPRAAVTRALSAA